MNPFEAIPTTVCDQYTIPVFPTDQDCTAYDQKKSEVCGIIILPTGATPPEDWTTVSGWAGVIDNEDTTNTSARYLVGKGSFVPNSRTEISLSGGRLVESRERGYRLNFSVSNMDTGHQSFGRKLQGNQRNFAIWLQTTGDRLIGGARGLKPFYVNADFPFIQGERERIEVLMDFFLSNSLPS